MPNQVFKGARKTIKICSCGFTTNSDDRTSQFQMKLHKKKCNGSTGTDLNEYKDKIKHLPYNCRIKSFA
jgi:hypothetical protein